MLVLGITGSIGTGKSTVSMILRSKSPWTLIDADVLAKELMLPGNKCYKKVIKIFGESIVKEDGQIDTNILGQAVFSNPCERKILNKIVHPEVLKTVLFQIFKAWIRGDEVVIVDVPLLFESGFDYLCGKIICVACKENTQTERLKTRNGYTKEESEKRIRSQMPLSSKIQLADIVIWNDGSKKDLEVKVAALIKNIQPTKTRYLLERILPIFAMISFIYTALKRWLFKKKKNFI
ncbi:dephospho-CoA kinase [Pneumocystis jirovecii RU7]|uniref:Dephospho-CoA kinase n=1 Tax=Pneumocystis jirovecii (strain RU7) TaxID=1408657 RepID=A0A0W4ZGU6_PNEJ7|nr:dephospho-CoA kinase [Pneumocystis jirovecii RU7]KTW27596.1 dephospho-CoA kinase [Pneumocystis jirovecii RU7]